MAQSLQGYFADTSQEEEDRQYVYEHYGTFFRAMLTMFEITLAPGAWGKIGRHIIYKVDRLYILFFFLYVSGVTFAIIRVITAIFLKETLAAASSDQEMAISERLHQQDKYNKALRALFEEVDLDGSGSISMAEFQAMLEDRRVKSWLGVL